MLKKLALFLPFALVPLAGALASPVPAQVAAPQRQAGGAARGAEAGQQARLVAALHLQELLGVMHEEGIDYGKQLADQLFPGEDGPGWQAIVRTIYDPAQMRALFEADFAHRLTPEQRAGALAFLTSPLGRRVVGLEISARRALLDPDVENAARARVRQMAKSDDPRLAQLRRFAEVNGLVEANVAGAMNANYAFYIGLADGHAPGLDLDRKTILRDVAAQEDEIRDETRAWIFPFLATAYKPLSDAELNRYIAFSQSPAGRALNRALFASFDVMFDKISRRLGLAAAGMLSQQNL